MIKLFDHKVTINSVKRIFRFRKFTVQIADISFVRFDGRVAKYKWLIFDRGDSVAVLVYRGSDRAICLVEQLRPPTLAREGKLLQGGGGILEIVAGTQERGEEAIDCLHREVAEEAGRLIKNVMLVTPCYMSPGASTEKISIYLAEDGGKAELPGGGLAAEGEDIRIHWVSAAQALRMIKNKEIVDAKTILAIQAFVLEEMQLGKTKDL